MPDVSGWLQIANLVRPIILGYDGACQTGWQSTYPLPSYGSHSKDDSMMKLRHLEVFHALMSASTMTDAAKKLNISQPALSVMLKHAEAQLGISLFERIKGRLRPTPEAEALFPEAEGVFRRLETINRMAKDLREGRSGSLAIAATPTLANAFLPFGIVEFQKRYPNIEFKLDAVTTPEVANRVAHREVDLGLVYAPTLFHGTEAEVIGTSEISCALRRDHPLAIKAQLSPKDLEQFRIVTYASTHPVGQLIAQSFLDNDAEMRAGARISHSMTCCLIANESDSVALIDRIAFDYRNFPEMTLVPLVPAITSNITFLWQADQVRSVAAMQFASILRAQIDILTNTRDH
jgi:DNA-binding transcriptional LysR family regulator